MHAQCQNVVHSYQRSPSPSPGPTPVTRTVAVIKAHAFGAHRRMRAKTKKTMDSAAAAKVALNVLEVRGINVRLTTDARHSQLDRGELDIGDS